VINGCSDKAEYQSIFNGSNLDGWTAKMTDQDQSKEFWFVEDSCIVARSIGDSVHDYMWLQYDKELKDFSLRFEFQPVRGNTGNTGVQVRSRYDDKEQWLNGPQVDIHPPDPWRTGMMWDETRGYQRWIFPDLPKDEWVNPDMKIATPPFYFKGDSIEWNFMEIHVKGLEVKAMLNEQLVTDFNGEGILDDSLHQNMGVGTSGYILFQIHRKDQLEIRFRNIELKES